MNKRLIQSTVKQQCQLSIVTENEHVHRSCVEPTEESFCLIFKLHILTLKSSQLLIPKFWTKWNTTDWSPLHLHDCCSGSWLGWMWTGRIVPLRNAMSKLSVSLGSNRYQRRYGGYGVVLGLVHGAPMLVYGKRIRDHSHHNLDLWNCSVSSYSLMYILDMSDKAWSKASHAAGSMDCSAFMAACMTAWCALRAST